jgi:hypothetical protein
MDVIVLNELSEKIDSASNNLDAKINSLVSSNTNHGQAAIDW